MSKSALTFALLSGALIVVAACQLLLGCAADPLAERFDAEDSGHAAVAFTAEPLSASHNILWPQNQPIPVCWENPTAQDERERGWIIDQVRRTWESTANIRFSGWQACTTSSRGVRIELIAEDYSGARAGGTALDGRVNGVALNIRFRGVFRPSCAIDEVTRELCIRTSAVHEFGHVLGFAHEHNRSDSPCDEPISGTVGDLYFGPWDKESVMNYCSTILENGGVLTATDMAGARALYGTRKLDHFGYYAGTFRGSKHVRTVADVNDDGRDDIIGFHDAGVQVAIAQTNGVGFDAPRQLIGDFGYNQGWRIDRHLRLMGDVNGDGRADIVAFGNDGTFLSLSGSSIFYAPSFLGDLGYNQGWRIERHPRVLADVDRDGRMDIVAFGDAGIYVARSLGGSFAWPELWLSSLGYGAGYRVEKHPRMLADMNNDGRADVVAFGESTVYVAFAQDGRFSLPVRFGSELTYKAGYRVDRHSRHVVDVNNDGLADVVAFGNDGVYLALATPWRFEPARRILGDFGYNAGYRVDQNPRYLADADGDGRPDIIVFGLSSVYAASSTNGYTRAEIWALRYGNADDDLGNALDLLPSEYVRSVGDFDADGEVDLISFSANGVNTTDLSLHLIPPGGAPVTPATFTKSAISAVRLAK